MRPNHHTATASIPPLVSASPGFGPWLPAFVLLAVLWGASFLFMRLGAAQFGAIPTAGLRVILASLFLLPLMLVRGEWPALRKHWKPVLFSGIINSAIPFSLFAFAVVHMPTGMASVLNASTPLFGAIIAWLWLGDRITALRVLGLMMGFTGVALLALHDKPASATATDWSAYAAMAACLCASLSYGVAASFAKRYLVGVPPLATATGSMVGASLCLLLPTIAMWPSQMPSWSSWLAIAALALLCTSVAYILYFHIIQTAGPSRAIAVTFLAPVFALVYGNWFLAEPITAWMLGCGAIIIGGTMLSTGLIGGKRP
ncbi:drug/metabolite transporter (DMT)-like permease [Comamonas sp. BIGb0152]|uniref:DMT family transporter n=1 Tax=Comamonas sp. BIGb0152 TaxID=2940601 RepID=UPI00216A49E9|nr:DMT family transporter [Comamonas sp. BIGb0152]MCS4295589.1 drug/metabolite transporter (DMT)-like permease [Comamonas sp. BIGb0152]